MLSQEEKTIQIGSTEHQVSLQEISISQIRRVVMFCIYDI